MKTLTTTTNIAVSPSQVWSVLSDIDRWPEWTPTVAKVERIGANTLKVGSRVKLLQPKLRPAVWTISVWEKDHGFTWVSRSPGTRLVAEHLLVSTGEGCTLRLCIHFQGFLGAIIGLLAGKLMQQYLELEAAGLKRRSELAGNIE